MDTEHASPQFKVGDEVRIVDRDDALLGAVGMVIAVWNTSGHNCKVQFDTGEDEWFRPDQLKHVGPLGVEYWRLLFRAHRDGWELLHCLRSNNFKYRSWCNDTTGDRFTLDSKRPVR